MGEFSAKQRECFERFTNMLFGLFGKANVHAFDETSFAMQRGSALVHIRFLPFGEERATINVFAMVAREVPYSEELMRELLQQNLDFRFGGFGAHVNEQGLVDVIFQHDILADALDEPELGFSVGAVAETSDRLDDEIVAKYGGLRMSDFVARTRAGWD